jgi:excinuclease UvrABC ATPase subunit
MFDELFSLNKMKNKKYQTVRTDCQNRQNTRLSEQIKYQTVRTDNIPDCQNRQHTRLSEHTKYQTVRTDKIPDCQNRQHTRLSEQTKSAHITHKLIILLFPIIFSKFHAYVLQSDLT